MSLELGLVQVDQVHIELCVVTIASFNDGHLHAVTLTHCVRVLRPLRGHDADIEVGLFPLVDAHGDEGRPHPRDVVHLYSQGTRGSWTKVNARRVHHREGMRAVDHDPDAGLLRQALQHVVVLIEK